MPSSTNPLTTSFTPNVPVELWRLVFRFATISPNTCRLYDTDFYPFRDSWMDNQTLDDTLDVKKAIVSVCKTWRKLGLEFLYEHMQACALVKLFKESPSDDERRKIGKFVLRLQLPSRPFPHEATAETNHGFAGVLKFCPRVIVLVQPPWMGGRDANETFWGDITHPRSRSKLEALLPEVRRIDWCTFGNDSFYRQHCTLLSHILLATPKLRYLSLRYQTDPFPGPSCLALPPLTTLRLEGEMGIYGLSLPNLTHLITSHIQATSDDCVLQRIPKLQILQLCGFSEGYQFDVFRLSPHLKEFCCSVHRETTIVLGCLHSTVRTVRLFCGTEPDRRTVTGFRKKSVMLYNATTFPALERIVLHGQGWKTFVHHSEFALFRLRTVDRGCRIEYPDGERLA